MARSLLTGLDGKKTAAKKTAMLLFFLKESSVRALCQLAESWEIIPASKKFQTLAKKNMHQKKCVTYNFNRLRTFY